MSERWLIGCERFGRVRNAFIARGNDAWSCDLIAAQGNHLQMDIFEAIEKHGPWNGMCVYPDCTYLCGSGLHWNGRHPNRPDWSKTEAALKFVTRLLACGIPRIALENPVGCIGTRIRPADQTIQPYQFGDDASKRTCLWLIGLPKLIGTKYVEPRIVQSGPFKGKKRWANQTDSGQNRLGPSETRAMDRAMTYQGIADAKAQQWGVTTPQAQGVKEDDGESSGRA